MIMENQVIKHNRTISTCQQCGNSFEIYRSSLSGKFCSRICYFEYEMAYFEKKKIGICQMCGNPFHKPRLASPSKFCSFDCYVEAQRKGVIIRKDRAYHEAEEFRRKEKEALEIKKKERYNAVISQDIKSICWKLKDQSVKPDQLPTVLQNFIHTFKADGLMADSRNLTLEEIELVKKSYKI